MKCESAGQTLEEKLHASSVCVIERKSVVREDDAKIRE